MASTIRGKLAAVASVVNVLDPRFVRGVPYMATAVQTAQMALKNPSILRPFPTSSLFDYVGTQYQTANGSGVQP